MLSMSATKGRVGGCICIDETGNLINYIDTTAYVPGLPISSNQDNIQERSVSKNGFSVTANVYGELTDDEIIQLVKKTYR